MSNNEMESVKSVASESETAKAVFSDLGQRQRLRHETDLSRYKTKLISKGNKIIEADYIQTFKNLQDLGVGSLVIGRRGKSTRFIWNYSLKDVASAAKTDKSVAEMKKIENKLTPPKKRGRKPGFKLNRKGMSDSPMSITFSLSPKVKTEDISALLSLIQDMNA